MSDKKLDVGGEFGDYRVVKLLGASGNVDVYLMRLKTTGQLFAMKIFMPPDGLSSDSRERFSDVIADVVQLRNENLVQIYDYGEDPETGLFYLIMDYIDGGTLAEYLAMNGAMDVADALKTAIVAFRTLNVVHSAGMMHGNIKTSNIMFMHDGTLKLADFGIANASLGSPLFSASAIKKGIPPSVAPEQVIAGSGVDLRADIYSLGVVLFEMLTGKRPDPVPTMLDMVVRVTNNDLMPDVRTINPTIPAAVAEAVAKLCAPKAEVRPKTAGEAAEMLLGVLTQIGGLKNDEESGGAHATVSSVKAKRIKIRAPKIVVRSSGDRNEREGGLGKILAILIILGVAVVGAFFVMKKSIIEGVPEQSEQPEEAALVNDPTIRTAIHNGYTWYFSIINSKAMLWRGEDGYHGRPCVEPTPRGNFVVPEKIGGFTVGALGSLAFHDCVEMTGIELPSTIESIGNRAFIQCRGLETLVLPAKVKSAGKWAFNSCNALRRVDIANCELLSDGGGIFAFCGSLEEICAASGNPSFKSVDGVLYSADGKTLVHVPAKKRIFKIPDGVEEIGEYAFCDGYAQEVTVPTSVRRIGSFAFKNCRELAKLTFAGDAPEMLSGEGRIFNGANRNLVINVTSGTADWPEEGSRWPREDGRVVRCSYPEITREWHDAKGSARTATLVGIAEDGKVAILRNPDEDKVRSLTISKLAEEDQDFINATAPKLRRYIRRNGHFVPED